MFSLGSVSKHDQGITGLKKLTLKNTFSHKVVPGGAILVFNLEVGTEGQQFVGSMLSQGKWQKSNG